MNTKYSFKLWLLGIIMLLSFSLASSVPLIITFQGRLTDQGSPAVGTHNMNFSIITKAGTTLWRNDASGKVPVPVIQGIYTIELGNTALTNMAPLSVSIFDVPETLYLRIWVNDEQLAPDIALISTPYSFISQQTETITANQAAGNSVINAVNLSVSAIDWARINKTGALPGDIGAAPVIHTHPGTDITSTVNAAYSAVTANYSYISSTANYAMNIDWTNIHNIPALADSEHQHTSIDDGGLLNSSFLYNITVTSANHALQANNATNASYATNAGTAAVANSVAWNNVSSKPASYNPTTHEHSATEITSGTLSVLRGGTNQTSYITNGVTYYNGTALTSNSNFTFTGTTLNIGSVAVTTVSANGNLDFVY